MTNIRINKERKYLFIGGAFVLFLGLFYRIAPYFQGMDGTVNEIDLKRHKAAQYLQLVKGKSEYQNHLNYLNRTIERLETALLTGDTPPLGAVDMQNFINRVADNSNVEIKTMQVLKPEQIDDSEYINVFVRINIACTIRQLNKILFDIETASKFLKVEKIKISASDLETMIAKTDLTISGVMKGTIE